jgi:hypothetical protein
MAAANILALGDSVRALKSIGRRRTHAAWVWRRCSRCGHGWPATSVMIDKFAGDRGMVLSELLDLNHTSKTRILVSLMIAKLARAASRKVRRTSQSGH